MTPTTSLYRSRLPICFSGSSPVLTAAQPLLILISRILQLPDRLALLTHDEFKAALSHEFQVFKTRLQQDYSTTSLKEQTENLIQQAFLEVLEQPKQSVATITEPILFVYVRQLMKQTDQPSADVLELAYILLSLVYCPQHNQVKPEQSGIDPLLEKLYGRLKHHKPFPYRNQTVDLHDQRFRRLSRKQGVLASLSHVFFMKPSRILSLILALSLLGFMVSNWHLNHVARTFIKASDHHHASS